MLPWGQFPLTESTTMNDVTSRVEHIAARAVALYSRPTVALEIVRLWLGTPFAGGRHATRVAAIES